MVTRLLIVFVLFFPKLTFSQLKTVIQQGHAEAVTKVLFTSNGNYALTGSRDKSIKIWEVETGKELGTFREHKATISDIKITSDKNYVISSSLDGQLFVWDFKTRRVIYQLNPGKDRVTSLVTDKDNMIYAGGYDGYVWKIDPSGPGKIDSIRVNPDKGLGVGIQLELNQKENLLLVGEDNKNLRRVTLSSLETIDTLKAGYGWCGGCGTYSDVDKSTIAKQSNSDSLTIITKTRIIKSPETSSDVVGVKIADNGQIVVGTEKELKVFNPDGDLIVKNEFDEGESMNSVDTWENKIITGHNDNIARIWDLETLSEKDSLIGILNDRDRQGIGLDPNSYWDYNLARYLKLKNNFAYVESQGRFIKGKPGINLKSWNMKTGEVEMEYRGHEYAVVSFAFDEANNVLVSGDSEGHLIKWNLSDGSILKTIKSHNGPVFDIDIKKEQVVSTSWDGRIVIRDLETFSIISQKVFESNSVYSCKFTPDGYYLAISTLGQTLELLETLTLEPVRSFVGHKGIVASIEFDQDGKTLVTSGWDGYVNVWNVETGLLRKRFYGHQAGAYAAFISDDQKSVVSAGADRLIKVWDLNTGKMTRSYQGHEELISSVFQVPEYGLLVSHSLDGATLTWDEKGQSIYYEHISTGPNDWLIKTSEGYFKGTDGSFKDIHFVKGLESFSLDQFFEDYYRPDIIQEIDFSKPAPDTRELENEIDKSPPPLAYLRAIQDNNTNTAKLFLRTIDTGGGVSRPELYHNGKKVFDITAKNRTRSLKDTTDYQLEVPLILGSNEFKFRAYSKTNISSREAIVSLTSQRESKEPEVYLLAIGINNYANPSLNLNYAKVDALSFSDSVYLGGKQLFKQVNVRTIIDEEATKEKIIEAMDDLATSVQPEDVFIFYYAGHGSMVDNQFYFIPTESKRLYDDKISDNAIPAELVQQKLSKIPALKQMIVMDACQSGASVDVLAKRGLESERALAQLARSTGIHVLASAGSEQFASEFKDLGHGLFTYVLLESLSGKADGAPKDGKITVYEIKSYLDDQVPQYNLKYKGTPQYPYTFSKGNDFPLIIINKE